jgi:hypothetical protein
MRRLTFSALFLLASGVLAAGCASIEEAAGVPEPFSWSYFQAPAAEVADAAALALRLGGLRVEGVDQTSDGGYVLTVSTRTGSAAYDQIYIEPFEYEVYESRAQTYPQGEALPTDLRVAISGEL